VQVPRCDVRIFELPMRYAFVLIFAAFALANAATLESDLRAAAALAGEPRTVSAAGLTKDERPILTLENAEAFDPLEKLRAVIYAAGGSQRAGAAVVDMVRWIKTSAPAALRDQWVVSALPSAEFDPADAKSFERWLRFQAPDVVVEVVDDDARPSGFSVDDVPAAVVRLPAAPQTIGATLTDAARAGRSRLHETIAARVRRGRLAIARLLAARYPETPGISYIPALAWVNTLRLARITRDDSLRERVRAQTQPWTSGEKPLFGDRIQLTAVAGTMIFAELARDADPAPSSAASALRALADRGADLAAARQPSGISQYGGGWTDDMFMAASVLARASQRDGRRDDLDKAARLVVDYAARLQRPDGLYNHAIDGPAAWGRGNGFAAFGVMETLTAMPDSHTMRAQLLDIFRRQMAAVKAQQAPDGAWREVIDEPGAYREETATAMLLTAMARGVRLGWLDATYRATIDRAWRALSAHVAEDGTVIDVCASTAADQPADIIWIAPR
jgi:unsaturated rhamnogalacturonyl hydrolase